MVYVVYGLEDPRDGLYHYIGITDDVYERFNAHVRGSSGNIHKNGWIFECRQANILIIMRELDRTEAIGEAFASEKRLIRHYMEIGHPITNVMVAKSIEKDRRRLERLTRTPRASKKGRTIQVLHKERRDALYPKALEAWNDGYKTKRSMAKHLGITEWMAQGFCKELKMGG